MKSIILTGFMGSGKSTFGKFLAQRHGVRLIDTDNYIERKYNRKIKEIFEEDGEEIFRIMETECIREIFRSGRPCIVSVGGGLPMRDENRKLLKDNGYVIYLKADVNTLEKRLSGDRKRPLIQGTNLRDRIKELMAVRESTYEQLADLIICTDNKNFEQMEKEIPEEYI